MAVSGPKSVIYLFFFPGLANALSSSLKCLPWGSSWLLGAIGLARELLFSIKAAGGNSPLLLVLIPVRLRACIGVRVFAF